MFGIGAQEAVVIGLLFLVIFGPNKLPGMARDFGRFVSGARRQLDEFKSEITATEEEEKDNPRREL
jgi:Sec-independent protein translocase protein TatA